MKKIYLVLSLLLVALYSCTDQSKFNNPSHFELERGAFLRFTNSQPAPTYEDPQAIEFSGEIYDPNNNVTSYSVTLKAVVAGSTYIAQDFFTATSFPANMSFNSQSIADAIGLDVSDLGFGDVFEFTATATRNDGVVFYGVQPTFDDDALTVGIGNTDAVLLSAPAYKNAMNFATIVACAFVQADMIGTYTILFDDGFSATGNDQMEVIAGPTLSQITLVNPYDSAGNFNITIDVNAFGIATFPRQDGVLTEEICCAGYSPTNFRSNALTSLALSCIGYIELHFATGLSLAGGDGTGFTFGDGTFIAQKN